MPRVFVRSVTGCHGCSYDRSQDATIARTIGRSRQRSIERTIGRWPSRFIVRRSLNATTSRAIPTMALVIDILQSFVITRSRVEIDRGMRPLLESMATVEKQYVALVDSRMVTRKFALPIETGQIK